MPTVPSENELYHSAFAGLQSRLPSTWRLQEIPRRPEEGRGPDAFWELRGPDGTTTVLSVQVARYLEPRSVSHLLEFLTTSAPDGQPFVVTSFAGSRTRELLIKGNAGYADATGSLRLSLQSPAVFIDVPGTEKNPWGDTRPVHSLKGPAAGRIVRALCDFRPPYGIIELAQRSHTPAASVSRVVSLLVRDALITRGPRNAVALVDWQGVLRRWTQDYAVLRSNRVKNALEPRGLDALLGKLKQADIQHAVTGSLAAAHVAPYAAARLAIIYVPRTAEAMERLSLRPVDAGTNVLLAEPFDPVVFDRTTVQDGVTYAALSQVAADLLTSPGRGPAEGAQLLEWMEAHEDEWRS
jgi:hypothetical protein